MTSTRRSLTRVVTLVALVLLAASGCTEKRPQVFSQGQGSYLETIEAWSSRFVDVTTGEVIGTPPTTNAQDRVSISPQVRNMNHFELVKLNIEDARVRELVQSPPFRARANAGVGVYQIHIKLTDNYLKFYKVAKPEDLPFEEHFYKEETFADGRISIPLLGYKVKSFYRIEKERTADDRESHHLIEVEEEDPARATHVRIDWGSRELFEAVRKVDLFPADFFFANGDNKQLKPYEWYYAETVIEKSLNDQSTIVGETATRVENSKLNPASKVVFLPREGELRVVNVARDERLSRDQVTSAADLNSEATLLLPIQWRDYRTKAAGTSLSLQGEKVEEVKWNERKYFEVDFLQLESAAIVNGGRSQLSATGKEGTNRLLDLEIDRNYFSFTILNMVGSNGRKIRYSFLRADLDRAPYTPKRSFKEDRNTFGFFSTKKPFYPNWEYYTESDFNKREYVSRMNPDLKEFVFHLSSDSPRELEGVAAAAVAAWDRAFQDALKGTGRQIRVRFSPDRAQLGDLRYNTIHLVDTLSEDNLLGFGPSVTDPETGEIVASTTNVYVNTFRAISANTVRQYIINRLENRLFPATRGENSSHALVADPVSLGLPVASTPQLADFKHYVDVISRQSRLDDTKLDRELGLGSFDAAKYRDQALSQRCEYGATIAATSSDEDIRKNCPEIEAVVGRYLQADFTSREAGTRNWNAVWQDSREAIRSCSDKFTRAKLLSTLIHELGHNFGLRHNFYGSVDKANFRKIRTAGGEEIEPQSSSIMEYTVWEEDRLTEAGKYDIAALRFGYGEQVELQDGTLVAVGREQSIAQSLQARSRAVADLRPYLFCTDEEAYLSFNALCRPHDYGTNPAEIVKFYIQNYEATQELRRLRRVRMVRNPNLNLPALYADDNFNRTFVPLKEIYDQWRYHLGEFVRKSNRYLTGYGPLDERGTAADRFEADLDRMKNDPVYSKVYADYFEASESIYKFFRDVAFGSNQYCLIEDGEGKRAIEFLRLRDLLNEATRGSTLIRGCDEAGKAADLATILGTTSVRVIGSVGYPVSSYRFDPATTTEQSLTDDVIGNGPTRQAAAMMLVFRNRSLRNALAQFTPNFLDDPRYLKEIHDQQIARITEGVRIPGIDRPLPIYEQEQTILSSFWKNFYFGLRVPNESGDASDEAMTRERRKPYTVYSPLPSEDVSSSPAVLVAGGRVAYIALRPEHVLAVKLIGAYNDTERYLKSKPLAAGAEAETERTFRTLWPAGAANPAAKIGDYFPVFAAVRGDEDEKGRPIPGFQANFPELYHCLLEEAKPVQQLETFMQALAADYRQVAGTENEKKLSEVPIAAYVKSRLKSELLLSQEGVESMRPAIQKCVRQHNEVASLVGKYRIDYNGRKSLILNVLSTFQQ